MTTEVERRYALRRLAAGDYLLLSNDARTAWRVKRYEEDGSAYWLREDGTEVPLVGVFWGLWRYDGRATRDAEGRIVRLDADESDWYYSWEFSEGMHATRAAAVRSALRQS